MATFTTLLNLIKPTTAENVDVAVINANMDVLDAKYGGARPVANAAARTALTPFQGQHVIEADTGNEYVYSLAAWRLIYDNSAWTTASLGLTNITSGNYTMVSQVQQYGKTVRYRFDANLTNVSAGLVSLNGLFPVAKAATVIGVVSLLRGGVWAQTVGQMTGVAGSTSCNFPAMSSAGLYYGQAGWTLASGDAFYGNLQYETT